mmetsp:Transcript_1853/g.2147  ORF Transcript_1853/g.2147 Transcript_1853/m.2147 type:complete len:274 (+) Transcript_1853:490-1311(+)|eukprot:CAMPEP_0184018246 /NCGR_PEP_ID=MMETSP0954-20121128/8035_1 /TAXON_ID=627963 /ORGANISM="Aplanochytrium sp, Strain PBS07" /LENGTH=273 /DNA_ID=CAMNT_0026299671 /DNA_START=461 /DNA_END=1282 /DNA_ORIENTATION=+
MGKGRKEKQRQLPMCEYGAGCKRKDCIYRHPSKDAQGGEVVVQNGDSNSVCIQFLSGECAFGSRCRNRHVTGDEAERILSKYRNMRCRWGKDCNNKNCLYFHEHRMAFNETNYKEAAVNESAAFLPNFDIPLPQSIVIFCQRAEALLRDKAEEFYGGEELDVQSTNLVEADVDQHDAEPILEGPTPVDLDSIPKNLPNYGAVLKRGLMDNSKKSEGPEQHILPKRSTSRLSQWMNDGTSSGSSATSRSGIASFEERDMVKLTKLSFQPLSRTR